MNITLIGMTGVGKSIIGKALADDLGVRFIDVDQCIEDLHHSSLQQLLNSVGDDTFLKIEQEAILSLDLSSPCVISPGGSVIYSPKAMEFLRDCSVVVFLQAAFDQIDHWIRNETTRGIVGLNDKTLYELFQQRQPLYQQYAHYTVDVNESHSINDSVKQIKSMLSL